MVTAAIQIVQVLTKTILMMKISMMVSKRDIGAQKSAVLFTDVEMAMLLVTRNAMMETEKEATAAPCIASTLKKASIVL